uniref:Uncharacterized protein n=1 Tax=Meloidogyne enterolobii TaxID=390850 RepID=A0A6V7XTN8_MELEN|nr:unnamed protein product [Meloidogyne enterolobii]
MSSKKPKGKFFDSVSDSTIDLQQLNISDNNITSEDTNSEQTKIAETDRTILETNGGVLSPTPSQFKILTIEGNGNKKPIKSSNNSNDEDDDCWNNPMLIIVQFIFQLFYLTLSNIQNDEQFIFENQGMEMQK